MAADWNVIKADYLLHHELSLSDLAKKFDVDYASLNSVASRERWSEERAIRGARIREKALAAAEISQVEELAAFDSDCLEQARAILGTVSIVLAEYRRDRGGVECGGRLDVDSLPCPSPKLGRKSGIDFSTT
jgi:hypothetical protein